MLKLALKFRICLAWLLIVTLGCPPQAFAGDSLFGGWGKKHTRPKTQLEQLAESVDKLEQEIDCYGSIVIKQPDIWGEARWTSHRQEFEKTMADELKRFKFTLNAQITEADTSFAVMAASLSASSGTTVVQAQEFDGLATQSISPIPVQQPDVYSPHGEEIKGITIEPTVYLDQMARYIKHLHQLRRINEGDDTADASGYALNLMRIPASILPGSKTRTGYGAELTVTVTPELSEDLLPETFKDLVFNDLVDQLSLPLLKLSELNPNKTKYEMCENSNATCNKLINCVYAPLDITSAIISSGNQIVATTNTSNARYAIAPTQIQCVFGETYLNNLATSLKRLRIGLGHERLQIFDVQGFLGEELEAAYQHLRALEERTGYSAWQTLCPQISQAIRLLKFDATAGEEALCNLRAQFDKCLETLQLQSQGNCPPSGPRLCPPCPDCPTAVVCKHCEVCTTKALAWAILVDSALLNDQLFDDMQRIQKAKHVYFAPDYNPGFYGPNPSPESKEIFNQYVQARWPIHVFALDPEVQEQNVADAYARRRETQLALAMAFANGEIGANTFSRFARQTDFQLETISLNRTVVGFSHGNDTFGWRFFPRVQAPPTPGNFKASWQNWVTGSPSRDDDLKCRQLEAGPRELLAIVVMPSFVPYLRVDSRSNWFKLTDPKCKEFTTEDSVRMGHMIQYIHNCKETCLHENHMYRPGDVMRVMQAVNQLENRLPLQDTLAQIPYENDLGGYRLFALGKRNLGPELIGFYGEPGINLQGNTNLFLVGRGFNVNATRVIVGGQDCDFDLLSRDVMLVKIPPGSYTVSVNVPGEDGKKKEEDHVDIHVATPYGVSGHLFVPIIKKPTSPPGYAFSFGEVFGCVNYSACCVSECLTLVQDDLVIKGPGIPGKTVNVKLKMVALFGDGTERGLKYSDTNQDTLLIENYDFTQGTVQIKAETLSGFMQGEPRLFAQQPPIALKVSGVVEIDKKSVNLGNQLLIKLAVQQARPCCPTPQEMIWTLPQALMLGCP